MQKLKQKLKKMNEYIIKFFWFLFDICVKFWFLFFLLYIILLYYIYDNSLYNLYLRSFSFCLIYFLYKIFYNYSILNTEKIKNLFKYKQKLNKMGFFIYKWSHIYFYWLAINNYLFDKLKKLRYILLIKYDKKILKKLMDIIDKFYFFYFYLVIESFFEYYINIYERFKAKILNFTYKDFFIWRIIMLSFTIIISFYIIKTLLNINSNVDDKVSITFTYYIIRVIVISNVIIFLKSWHVYKKNYFLCQNEIFSKNRILLMNQMQGPGYLEPSILRKIYLSRYFFNKIYFKFCNEKVVYPLIFNGNFLENKYWYRFDLYKKDIEGNINIEKFNQLIYLLNITILKRNSWKIYLNFMEFGYLPDSDFISVDKNNPNKILIQRPINFYKNSLNIKDLNEKDENNFFLIYLQKYQNHKNIERIRHRLNMYDNFLLELKAIFEWLDNENIVFTLIVDHTFAEDYEITFTKLYYENIWVYFQHDIKNFKFETKKAKIIFDEKLQNLANKITLVIENDEQLITAEFEDFVYLFDLTLGDNYSEFCGYPLEFFNSIDIENIEIDSINLNIFLEQLKKISKSDIRVQKGIWKLPKILYEFLDLR